MNSKYPYVKSKLTSEGIVSTMLKYLPDKINSVIDIGCGNGALLKEFKRINSEIKIKGFDMCYDSKSSDSEFEEMDFERLFHKNQMKFYGMNFDGIFRNFISDLCVCTEVIEHLKFSFKQNQQFIKFLTELSDMVLFSGAIPYQYGINHVNCHWQSYYINIFHVLGYWHIPINHLFPLTVSEWHRQNCMLFVKDDLYNDVFRLIESQNGFLTLYQNHISVEQYMYFVDKITLKDFLRLWWEKKKHERQNR